MAKKQKKQKTSLLDDVDKMTAKQRQQAASQAGGLVAGRKGAGSKWDVPASEAYKTEYYTAANYRAALQGKTSPKARYGIYTNARPGESITYDGPVWQSKQAQDRFLASEKKKSGKTTAQKVKRRER